jgi:hypothetical protein
MSEADISGEETTLKVQDVGKMLGILDKVKNLGNKEEVDSFRNVVRAAKAGTMQLSFAATKPFLGK